MRLSFVAVVTDPQFRDLLHVRNECRDGLTHDTSELTLQDQKKFRANCWFENVWWQLSPHPTEIVQLGEGSGVVFYEPYLLYNYEWPIGYGLLKYANKKYWMTIGLVKEYRGKGLSRLLIHYITEMGHREGHEVWLDVLNENRRAYEGYLKAGYKIVERDAEKHDTMLTVMRHIR